jgi:hypothetical protein
MRWGGGCVLDEWNSRSSWRSVWPRSPYCDGVSEMSGKVEDSETQTSASTSTTTSYPRFAIAMVVYHE